GRRTDTTGRERGGRFGAWLSLVERLLWEQDVGGSNPLAPTSANRDWSGGSMALARIYRPTKGATQSGTAKTKKWTLDYELATRRAPDPLMGWATAHDTLNEVRLHFDTLEEAIAFAKKEGLDYTVITPRDAALKPKSYADNFRYNRPT